MIKLCVKAIAIPLKVFPDDWKKVMKNDLKLSICQASLVCNSLFDYFIQNKLFPDCQYGFIPGNSYQLRLKSKTLLL